MLDRRSLATGAFLSPLMLAGRAYADAAVQEFAVDRNGTAIGRHRLTFTPDGARLGVDISIELEVKFAFITLYRYRHSNRELWEDGQLVNFSSRTNDNGKSYRVDARREGGVILVESGTGRVEVSADAMPSSYWHRRFLGAPAWIDTQAGRLLRCKVAPIGPSQVLAAGKEVSADGFAVTGDLTLDLWYAKDHWVKLHFPGSDGSSIDYRLERGVPQLIAMTG